MSRAVHHHFLIANDNPSSPISEAYKTLRTNLRFSAVDHAVKVIVITSCLSAEGRTTTATNLAVTYAQENKRVLLVDGDLRRPSIHHIFLRPNSKGLTDLLIGNSPLKTVISKTDVPNLSVLTSGEIPPNPSEMLGSERMRDLLAEWAEQYDMVIIDSPPALAVTDAQILGALSDGVVLVVSSGKVEKQALRRVKSNLEHVNARILGVVLNHAADHYTASNYTYSNGGTKDDYDKK